MAPKKTYLFGPVPSRRLGLSLGVDIVPLKTCTQNCIYCQLGLNAQVTIERKTYVPIDDVIKELRQRIDRNLQADYITISGSGEPTLNSQIGLLIDRIRQITNITVAIITNSTLLSDPKVRADCAKADVVLPSLDAGDEQTFQKINHPHKGITFSSFIDGLAKFRAQFKGQIWLEVFLCKGINTSNAQIDKINAVIQHINPEKIHLNTVVRPTAESSAVRVPTDKLSAIAQRLGPAVEVVADYSNKSRHPKLPANEKSVLAMLKRRPCTINDICLGLGISQLEATNYIQLLEAKAVITAEKRDNKTFYKKK